MVQEWNQQVEFARQRIGFRVQSFKGPGWAPSFQEGANGRVGSVRLSTMLATDQSLECSRWKRHLHTGSLESSKIIRYAFSIFLPQEPFRHRPTRAQVLQIVVVV